MKEVAENVWQLAGFPPNAINAYVIEDVLIDAATKWAKPRVKRELKGRTISMHALTHVHPDHQGVSKWVCETHGVELACPAGDVDSMEGRAPVQRAKPNHPLNRFGKLVWTGPPHPVGRVLNEGDEVAGFKVINAPGHTPGHVIYFRESDGVAIAGDVINNMNLLTAIPGLHEAPEFFTFDVEQARESIRKLADLDPSVVCVGHGPPLRRIGKLKKFAANL